MSQIVERLGAFIKNKGMSIRSFELSIGASNGAIGRAISNGSDINSAWVSKIIDNYPEINIVWLISGQGEMLKTTPTEVLPAHTFTLSTDRRVDVQDIPLYDLSATAGLVAVFNDSNVAPEDYLRVPSLPPVDGAIYVRGESMTPLLNSGDIIIYKRLEPTIDSILWGQIYLLSFTAGDDSFTVIKFLQKSDRPGYVRLVSRNERFQPKDIPLSGIRVLALVKASITFHTIE